MHVLTSFAQRHLIILLIACVLASTVVRADPSERDVMRAMERATTFMTDSASTNGGYVWRYKADLSEQWGEVPARPTMIWVQDPGTVGVGNMLLDAWKLTGEEQYLDGAKAAANALIWGQHPSGGWHYFIDFDMTGVRSWYDTVLSRCWGWEEYYHYYGNCTFDDNVSTGATRFLMDLYMATLDPSYRVSMLRALDFILESQYPNGAWPQRYPLKYEYPHDGHADYTAYYTFNDGVTAENIYLLNDAWEQLGDETYREAALRGMDFFIIAQMPAPQGGWGAQYDFDLQPAAARAYEPAAIMVGYTQSSIRHLQTFYKMTGDRRYLKGIPRALEWLEASYLPESVRTTDRVTHATFYEPGTNRPLYAHREGTSIDAGRYWVDYEPRNFPGHYGMQTYIDVPALRTEFERTAALPPDAAVDEFRLMQVLPPATPTVDPDTVETIIDALDDRGAWVESITIRDYEDLVHNPRLTFEGISTATYIRNMSTLMKYLRMQRSK
jgi:hypothetical protein